MIKFLRYYIYNLVNLLFNYIDKPRGLLTLSGLALEQFQFFNQDSVKDQLKIIMGKK
jgi:hypothetical protein